MHTLRSNKRKPTHPGVILREDILPELNMTPKELALRLGITSNKISQILNEHISISTDIAIRLAHFLDTTPNVWLNMQHALDIWELENNHHATYEKIKKYA